MGFGSVLHCRRKKGTKTSLALGGRKTTFLLPIASVSQSGLKPSKQHAAAPSSSLPPRRTFFARAKAAAAGVLLAAAGDLQLPPSSDYFLNQSPLALGHVCLGCGHWGGCWLPLFTGSCRRYFALYTSAALSKHPLPPSPE